ncbi:replication factor C small subunit [Candidatus Woesearchaeota archaeon]|nr:replication factor C small subunit [Candidatus Woesearchaeota archaeon]
MQERIWTEKYRPISFKDIVGQIEIVKRIKAMIEQKNLTNLLFAGPAGVGKTSLILAAARELYGDSWRQNILNLNASDDRGIDIIRNEVKDFARTKSLGDIPFKICILDEADSLTKEAQQALRRTMEDFSNTCRFCLIANYSSKIIDPIQSRCAVFRFKPLTKDEVEQIIKKIASEEKIKLDKNVTGILYDISEGDVRKLENIMQSCSSISDEINEKIIYDVVSAAKPKDLIDVLRFASQGQFIKAKEKLIEIMLQNGLSGLDVIKQIQKEIWNLSISDESKLSMIEKCGEIEFRMVEGSDEFVQLEALLASLINKK